MIELVSILQYLVSPGIRGSSGILLSSLSSSFLKLPVLHPVIFRRGCGNELKSLGPLTGSDEYLIFLMELVAVCNTEGTLHCRPRRSFLYVMIGV